METTELVLRLDHPPHRTDRKSKGPLFLRTLNRVLFSLLLLFLISHLPFVSSGIQHVGTQIQKAGQSIAGSSGLREFLLFFNPGLQRKQEAIRNIIEVLERYPTGLAVVTKEELAEVIYEEAIRYDYDPKFIVALIAIESSFQNWSVSERGAKGLMQIMPYVAQSLAKELDIEWNGDRTLFNPFLNIKMGIHYLTRLSFDFDDVGLALEAYNHGPTKVKALVERRKKVPLRFYRKILDAYEKL